MRTVTESPKRKRGEHKTRHPWNNAAAGPIQRREEFGPYDAWQKFRHSKDGQRVMRPSNPIDEMPVVRAFHAFTAGYIAGKAGR